MRAATISFMMAPFSPQMKVPWPASYFLAKRLGLFGLITSIKSSTSFSSARRSYYPYSFLLFLNVYQVHISVNVLEFVPGCFFRAINLFIFLFGSMIITFYSELSVFDHLCEMRHILERCTSWIMPHHNGHTFHMI